MFYIKYTQKDHVGVITLDRPDALNALHSALLCELEQVLDAVGGDTRCIVVTGAGGKAFAAGADIAEMMDMGPTEAAAYAAAGNRVFRKLELLPVPVIAAVGGYALGGGCELCLACDIRLCSDNAVFGQPEVGLGITPGFGGTQRLARLVGAGAARELLYTAARIDAARALAIGLVNAVYPAQALQDKALEMAERIAKGAPYAVQACKRALREGMDLPLDEALSLETTLFSRCFDTQDQKNAMRAFAERREPPSFIGE